MIDLEKNKSNAQAFYDLMFNQCEPRKAIEQFVGNEYVQHNPHVADGKEAFIKYFERMAAEFPWPGEQNYAGIDIFRFDAGGKIVEHWDVLQVITAESKNDNGLF